MVTSIFLDNCIQAWGCSRKWLAYLDRRRSGRGSFCSFLSEHKLQQLSVCGRLQLSWYLRHFEFNLWLRPIPSWSELRDSPTVFVTYRRVDRCYSFRLYSELGPFQLVEVDQSLPSFGEKVLSKDLLSFYGKPAYIHRTNTSSANFNESNANDMWVFFFFYDGSRWIISTEIDTLSVEGLYW